MNETSTYACVMCIYYMASGLFMCLVTRYVYSCLQFVLDQKLKNRSRS